MTQATVNNPNELSTLRTTLLSTLDEKIFFTQLCNHIAQSFTADKFQVYLAYDDGRSQLISENGQEMETPILDKGFGLSGYVIRTKRPYYSNSVKRDPLLSSFKNAKEVEAELAVPVMIKGSIVATIHLQAFSGDADYSDKEIVKIMEILKELETPLANIKMYLAAKHLNQELSIKVTEKEEELANSKRVEVNHAHKADKAILVGQSAAFIEVLDRCEKMAKCDLLVLIEGETGTGKESIARRMHNQSARSDAPYVVVNCSAMTERKLEEDLFGIVGDSDNEIIDREGLVERAHGGTLVLEEISELTPYMQAKIMNFIESGKGCRLGSTKAYSSNVRVISLSKKNLVQLVEEGRFREDLLHRISSLRINMPAMVERKEDIKILADYFLNLGKEADRMKSLTSSAVERLLEYSWPGNIRELKNIMERVYIMSDSNFIDVADLPECIHEVKQEVVEEVPVFKEMTLEQLEKQHICSTLSHLNGNKTKTAKALGITVKTLYNKLHSYGMVQPRN